MGARDTVMLYPISKRGHIVPMLELGKLIHSHHPELSITLIISSNVVISDTANYPFINLHYLPASSSTTTAACSPFSLSRLNNPSLHTALSNTTNNIRALILDFFNTPGFQVAEALNIPTYYYFTSGATGLAPILYYPTLSKTMPLQLGQGQGQGMPIIFNIPGMPPIAASDMPGTHGDDPTALLHQELLEIASYMAKSSGIIINTVESLESKVLAALRDGLLISDGPTPPIFTIGPVVDTSGDIAHCTSSRHESLKWLDSQPSASVVFLCFGSMGVFSTTQLKEMATGLERSGVRFLWVVRPPPPDIKTGAAVNSFDDTLTLDMLLPVGFLDRTRDRGLMLKSWAPQVDVLRHGSVGGFVTHCGWNSILEAVSSGVPMVAWPLYAEQKLNRVFLVDEAKIAIRVAESEQGFVSADELESRVVELMTSVTGNELRKNVAAMRDAVIDAKADGGTSRVNLDKLVDIIKQQY